MEKVTNFNELVYKRIDYDKTKDRLNKLISALGKSKNFNDFLINFKEIINIQNEIEEMYDYADIRNMRDLKDEYFNDEIAYWNAYKPKFDSLFLPFYDAILKSEYKTNLSSLVPPNFFKTIEYQKRITDKEINDLLKKEQELKKEYQSLTREKVTFNGEEMNLAKLNGFMKDNNRDIRKEASDVYNDYYLERQEYFDRIFLDLISVRKEIAEILGFDNYVEYSLYKLRRFNYDYNDIHTFRDNIRKYVNPLIESLRAIQKENLGIKELEYFDNIFFKASPKPLYEGKCLLKKIEEALKFDQELLETYHILLENGYIDFLNRDNKVGFSITNYLCKTGLPVITGSYKNTYYDITATTHELGHAYQKYNAGLMDKNYIVSPLLKYPTMEIAEMFSHALSIISLPHLKCLFKDVDYSKYCIEFLYDLISLLPYICLVDEFQETIYLMDEIDSNKIHATWLKLASKYNLEYQNKGNENLEKGNFFYRQVHIFTDPFYYIDYAISIIESFSLASSCEDDLSKFKSASSVASYYPIKELSKKFDIPDPFKEESIKLLVKKLELNLKEYYKELKK